MTAAAPQWISVAERLPEDGVWCWVKMKPATYKFAELDDHAPFPAKRYASGVGGWTNEDTWEDFRGEVTHWAALPEPPKT